MSISENLKFLRNQKGLTQKELATKIGVALSVIGDIESGRRMPSKRTAQKLSQYFNTPLEYWINEDSNTYIHKREKFAMTDQVIKKLKEKGYIKNGIPTDEGWEFIKEGLLIDLKFMELEEGEEEK